MNNQEILRYAVSKYPEIKDILIECNDKLLNIDEYYQIIDICEISGKLIFNAEPSEDNGMWDWKLESMFNRTIRDTEQRANEIWIETGRFEDHRRDHEEYLKENRKRKRIELELASQHYPELKDLLEEADRRLTEVDPNYIIHQIKEKYGTLRYYASPSQDSQWDNTYSEKSEKIEKITNEIENRGTQIWIDSGFYFECYPNYMSKRD